MAYYGMSFAFAVRLIDVTLKTAERH